MWCLNANSRARDSVFSLADLWCLCLSGENVRRICFVGEWEIEVDEDLVSRRSMWTLFFCLITALHSIIWHPSGSLARRLFDYVLWSKHFACRRRRRRRRHCWRRYCRRILIIIIISYIYRRGEEGILPQHTNLSHRDSLAATRSPTGVIVTSLLLLLLSVGPFDSHGNQENWFVEQRPQPAPSPIISFQSNAMQEMACTRENAHRITHTIDDKWRWLASI